MTDEPVGTKRALILAAGELFAEHGLEGTSIRAITEKAKANIAAVNYHFGSKENLYKETLLYAARRGTGLCAVAALRAARSTDGPQGVPNAIRQIASGWCARNSRSQTPRWCSRLLALSIVEPDCRFRPVLEDLLQRDVEALKTLFQRARPEMSHREALLWAYGLIGQFAFYTLARSTVLATMNWEHGDQEFPKAAADHVVRSTVAALGLPALG